MITVDYGSYISAHVYDCKDRKRVPLLLTVNHATCGGKVDDLTKLLLATLMDKGDSDVMTVMNKLISFGANGVRVSNIGG